LTGIRFPAVKTYFRACERQNTLWVNESVFRAMEMENALSKHESVLNGVRYHQICPRDPEVSRPGRLTRGPRPSGSPPPLSLSSTSRLAGTGEPREAAAAVGAGPGELAGGTGARRGKLLPPLPEGGAGSRRRCFSRSGAPWPERLRPGAGSVRRGGGEGGGVSRSREGGGERLALARREKGPRAGRIWSEGAAAAGSTPATNRGGSSV